MAAGLRKCIDMGPFEYGNDFEDVRYGANLAKIQQSGTRWVRLWVRWDLAEPTQGNLNGTYLTALDDQISQLRASGISVMLVSWLFPQWTNGTQNLPENDPNYNRAHRVRPDGSGLKSLKMQVPTGQLGINGAWGRWIRHLYERYMGYGNVCLELVNEPNYQMWPQRQSTDPNSSAIIHQKVAEMMYTAYQISAGHGHTMAIAAPATSDFRRASSVYETNQGEFISNLTAALSSYNNFRGGPTFLWTHHHYKDTEVGDTAGVDVCRFILINWGWHGWSATNPNGSDPGIWLTEGGARRHLCSPPTYERQRDIVQNAWFRMSFYPGIAMYCNYLLHSVPDPYDQGLRDPIPSTSGGLRPVGTLFHSWPGQA
ncbi:MAG: Beta-galactosidase [Thermoleophilaceae bacterium]|jgi:hypothetical protein|nr:Beta-galactosidase [Thermoleophilaceae bacterium]